MTELFHRLRAANPGLDILPVGDPAFGAMAAVDSV